MDIPSFEFDAEKNRLNLEKHGISLEEAQELWFNPHFTIPAKSVKGEERFHLLGWLDEKLHVATFTMRGETVRLISCHRADERLRREWERMLYEKKEN